MKSQEEILEELVSGLGLERRKEALGVSIQEAVLLEKVPKELENFEPLQGVEEIYHKLSKAGDYTDVITRAFRLPRGYLRSLPRQIRGELVDREIVRPREPVLGRIRGPLRTDWLTAGERGKKGYYILENIMEDLHKELARPRWTRDVIIPASVDFQEGVGRMGAQIFRLHRRRVLAAVQLPREAFY